MRQEQSRPCTISRPWRGAKADRGLEMPGRASPKTTEPLLVSPPKATTGVRWASLGGSIAPAATCKWRAWSTNSLAPLGSCVSQSLNTCSFCILRLGVDGGSLHAQTQSPPLLSDWSLFDGTWIAVNLPVRYKRPGCRSGTSTFSSVRKLRLWLPLRFDFGRPLFRVQLFHIRYSLCASLSISAPLPFPNNSSKPISKKGSNSKCVPQRSSSPAWPPLHLPPLTAGATQRAPRAPAAPTTQPGVEHGPPLLQPRPP